MKFFKTVTSLFLLGLALPLGAVTPMDYYNSLVAGDEDPGYRDGAFDDARFKRPSGLAFDETGSRLFVTDEMNHRIRVIYLDEDNRVETLAGTGTANGVDGSLTTASFNAPSVIAYLPGNRLAVYEAGDQSVRMVDLKNNKVTTLTQAIGLVWNMAYWPKDDSLYLTEPVNGSLKRVDLKTAKVSTVLSKDAHISQPQALCYYQDQFYVTDGVTSKIYQMEVASPTTSEKISITLKEAGKGKQIMELAGSDGSVYALQAGDVSIAQVLPAYQPVSLISPWGFVYENTNPGYSPIISVVGDQPIGFAGSPQEKRKLYVSGQNGYTNSILSFKDYHFGDAWFARDKSGGVDQLSDFDYPAEKPKKTIRVLVLGSSRLVTAPTVFPGEKLTDPGLDVNDQDAHSLKTNTFCKQLELMLNANAALNGKSNHYEILMMGHPGMNIQFFRENEIIDMVNKYHVDLVLGLVTPTNEEKFQDYYMRPLNADGIPFGEPDPEFLLKSWKDKIPPGAPTRLYESCLKRKMVSEASPTQLQFALFQDLLLAGDQEIRDDLIEMIGKPLKVLAQKLQTVKKPDGQTTQFGLFFVPGQDARPIGDYESFWLDLSTRNNLKILDLTRPFEDLKTSFYPTSEDCCHRHYTAYGNGLIAYLLSYYLPKENWITF